MTTIVKSQISQAVGQALIDDIFLGKSKYYYGLGRSYQWNTLDLPIDVIDTEKYENSSRNDTLILKRIDATSVSFSIPRIDYNKNVIYDIYDDSISLVGKNYYVLNSDYNVYKCLYNSNGKPSTQEPFGTSINQTAYSDGYVWKFIYTIPPSLRNKFLTPEVMPVYNSITEKYYSRGSLTNIIINAAGDGYTFDNTTITVSGDGYLQYDPYKIQTISVTKPGSGYASAPAAETADIFKNATAFQTNTSYQSGQYTKVSDSSGIRFYYIESAGISSSTLPSHYYTIFNNGTASLRHVGTKPKINTTVDTTAIGNVNITDPGFGYSVIPTLTKASPGTGFQYSVTLNNDTVSAVLVLATGTGYTNNTITVSSPFPSAIVYAVTTTVAINNVLSYNNGTDTYFYKVTGVSGASKTGSTAPTHTTGSQLNGDVILTAVGKTAKATALRGTVSSATSLLDVASIKITNGGTGYSEAIQYNAVNGGSNFVVNPNISVTFTGGNPIIPAQGTAIIANGAVVKILILYPGYGYQSAPTVTISGNGTGAAASATMQSGYGYQDKIAVNFAAPSSGVTAEGTTTVKKSEAKLEPVIIDGKIRGINQIDPGIAYTTAKITVTGDGTGASLSPLFAAGDLSSIQAQNELFATPGTLSSVKIISAGSGISSFNVSISGDGTGAVVTPVINSGSLLELLVTSPGTGYTYMNLTVTANSGAVLPVIRAILSPVKGHGSNPIKEFYTKSVGLYGAFSDDTNNGFSIDNSFRQILIYKNPLRYNANTLLENRLASPCLSILANISSIPLISGIIVTDPDNSTYRVISISTGSVLLQPLNNSSLSVGDVLKATINNINYNIVVTDISAPQVDKYSGEILYIDNVKPFSPSKDQAVTITTTINLN